MRGQKLHGVAQGKFIRAFVIVALFQTCAAHAADEGNSAARLTIYSDMNFIENEGEFSGLQIVLVPYYDGEKSRRKILWRSAGPFLKPPLLLEAVQEGKSFKVLVPQESDDAGAWTLTLRGNVFDAAGPGGLKYSLKKIRIK
jgi:hypothetical protein